MTHEAGIEAAWEIAKDDWQLHSSAQRKISMLEQIKAYLSASGMVLVPREPDNAKLDERVRTLEEKFLKLTIELNQAAIARDLQASQGGMGWK